MTKKIRVIQTAKDTEDRLTEKDSLEFKREAVDAADVFEINRDRKAQKITGFGGAFTEAGAYTLAQVPAELRDEVLEAYFHPEKGIAYSLCRTHINSCDFSLG
ncbi:MAG: glucosylceramidase, partial [Halanaerobium sp.]